MCWAKQCIVCVSCGKMEGKCVSAVQNSILCVSVVGRCKVNVCVLCKTVYCVC